MMFSLVLGNMFCFLPKYLVCSFSVKLKKMALDKIQSTEQSPQTHINEVLPFMSLHLSHISTDMLSSELKRDNLKERKAFP